MSRILKLIIIDAARQALSFRVRNINGHAMLLDWNIHVVCEFISTSEYHIINAYIFMSYHHCVYVSKFVYISKFDVYVSEDTSLELYVGFLNKSCIM